MCTVHLFGFTSEFFAPWGDLKIFDKHLQDESNYLTALALFISQSLIVGMGWASVCQRLLKPQILPTSGTKTCWKTYIENKWISPIDLTRLISCALCALWRILDFPQWGSIFWFPLNNPGFSWTLNFRILDFLIRHFLFLKVISHCWVFCWIAKWWEFKSPSIMH